MGVSVNTDWTFRGLDAIIIENELLRVDIFPQAGAKIYNYIFKPADHNFMWHHPRIDLAAVPLGLPYDDHFSGGWDELFPNDAPGLFQGASLPDHGELWCRPWDYDVIKDTPEEVILYLHHRGAVTSTIVEKWLTLRSGEAKLHFKHRITNIGKDQLSFLWKLHPAISVDEYCRVDVPGRRGEFVDPGWSRLSNADSSFDWPIATNPSGEKADISVVLPIETGKKDFVYVSDLSAGWCALTNSKKRIGFALVFPKKVFPYVWLFMPAGGWRDIHTVVMEPCTACPKDLNIALKRGSIAQLAPGEKLECDVMSIVYYGIDSVSNISENGIVFK